MSEDTYILRFGMFRNVEIDAVPTSYLKRLLEWDKLFKTTREAILDELDRRGAGAVWEQYANEIASYRRDE